MVAEADESDRSFLKLSPTVAVVTNIDREHLDAYRDLDDLQEAFLGFVNKVPFYGAAVLCLDDAPVQDILPRVERRVVTYGLVAPGRTCPRATLAVGPRGLVLHGHRGREVRSGPSALAVPGRAQRRQLAGRGGGGRGPRARLRRHPRRPRVLHRRRPPLPGAGRGGRRDRDRRLRPPPHRDPGHARDAAHRGRAPPHGRPLPAPPLLRARRRCGTTSAAPSTWPTCCS